MNRLSQTLVSYLIYSHTSYSNLSCRGGRRRCSRIDLLVVSKSPRPSSIYRYTQGSIFCPERHPIFSYGVDGLEAGFAEDWTSGRF
jgi:hypothetical protein